MWPALADLGGKVGDLSWSGGSPGITDVDGCGGLASDSGDDALELAPLLVLGMMVARYQFPVLRLRMGWK